MKTKKKRCTTNNNPTPISKKCPKEYFFKLNKKNDECCYKIRKKRKIKTKSIKKTGKTKKKISETIKIKSIKKHKKTKKNLKTKNKLVSPQKIENTSEWDAIDEVLHIFDAGGGGDCMFLSLAKVFNINKFQNKNWTAKSIRKLCADSITLNDFNYAKYQSIYTIPQEETDLYLMEFDINDVNTLKEFKKHIKQMGNHYWGDQFLLSIISKICKINIVIIQPEEQQFNFDGMSFISDSTLNSDDSSNTSTNSDENYFEDTNSSIYDDTYSNMGGARISNSEGYFIEDDEEEDEDDFNYIYGDEDNSDDEDYEEDEEDEEDEDIQYSIINCITTNNVIYNDFILLFKPENHYQLAGLLIDDKIVTWFKKNKLPKQFKNILNENCTNLSLNFLNNIKIVKLKSDFRKSKTSTILHPIKMNTNNYNKLKLNSTVKNYFNNLKPFDIYLGSDTTNTTIFYNNTIYVLVPDISILKKKETISNISNIFLKTYFDILLTIFHNKLNRVKLLAFKVSKNNYQNITHTYNSLLRAFEKLDRYIKDFILENVKIELYVKNNKEYKTFFKNMKKKIKLPWN